MQGTRIAAINARKIKMKREPYTMTIRLRSLRFLMERICGRSCFPGRSQKSMREWTLSMYGIRQNKKSKKSMKWPSKKSAANIVISTVLQINSRNGCMRTEVYQVLVIIHVHCHERKRIHTMPTKLNSDIKLCKLVFLI